MPAAVTPELYGAVPNDGQDDTDAVQAAIDNNAAVYLNGTYLISRSIELRSGRRIYSHGRGGLKMSAAGFDNSDPAIEYTVNAIGLSGKNISNLQLQNFFIEKEFEDQSSVSAVRIRGGDNISISGLDVSGFSNGLAIALDSVSWGFVTGNIIRDSYTSSEAQHTGVAIDSSRLIEAGEIINSNALMVTDNFIFNLKVSPALRSRNRVETDGINIAGPETHDVWLQRNAIGQVGEGIDSFGQRVSVHDNRVYESYLFGIKLIHGASDSVVSSNDIVRPAKVGIVLSGSTSVQRDTRANRIIDNYISGVGQHADIDWRPKFTAGISLESHGNETGHVVDNFIDHNRIADTARMDFGVNCDVPFDNQITNVQLDGPALKEGLRDCR